MTERNWRWNRTQATSSGATDISVAAAMIGRFTPDAKAR
jgi:hypothetical protein